MTMEFGFFIPHLPVDIFTGMALSAENHGFDFICCDDHLMNPFASGEDDFGCYEAWTAMTYLAGMTKKIKLSHMVLIPGLRNPSVLANMGATLDVLSKGRFILTAGAGWYEKEFNAYGLPFESHNIRIKREREAIQLIRALWEKDDVTFNGDFYTSNGITVKPKPFQKPAPPIWISGDSRPSMELAAELGDGLQLHGHSPDEVHRMMKKITPMISTRDNDFSIGSSHVVVMGADSDKAYEKLRSIVPPATWERFMKADIRLEIKNRISGTPDQCLKRIKEYIDVGLKRLIFIFFDPADVEIFAKEVLPEIREYKN